MASVTPIMQSLVTSSLRRSSLQPSVPSGRIGTTMYLRKRNMSSDNLFTVGNGPHAWQIPSLKHRHAKALVCSLSPGTCNEGPCGGATLPEVRCGVMHMDCHALWQLGAKLLQHRPRLTHLHEMGKAESCLADSSHLVILQTRQAGNWSG